MSGVKGRSGRRPLAVEAKRLLVIDKAWKVTEEALGSGAIELKDRAYIAGPIVRSDMAKPVVIDQSQHTHITSIQVDSMQADQLVELVMGRSSGRQNAQQPA